MATIKKTPDIPGTQSYTDIGKCFTTELPITVDFSKSNQYCLGTGIFGARSAISYYFSGISRTQDLKIPVAGQP